MNQPLLLTFNYGWDILEGSAKLSGCSMGDERWNSGNSSTGGSQYK
jgi:hypothetical protein